MHDFRSLGTTEAGINNRTRLCLDEQGHGSCAYRRPDMGHVDLDSIVCQAVMSATLAPLMLMEAGQPTLSI
jgi:hypothetical protein